MKLIYNWKQAWKMHSVKIFAIIILLPVAWEAIPDYVKADLPTGWVKWIASGLAVLGVYSRLLPQPSVRKEDSNDSTGT